MKKILLATALAAVSISATEANWGGFYARGGLSALGGGHTSKENDKVSDGRFGLQAALEIAAGWGMTVANSVYLGVDAQIANLGIAYTSSDATEVEPKRAASSNTNFAWTPNLQVRIGLPLKSAMPYIAGGFGAVKSFTEVTNEKGEKTTPDMEFSWSARVGSDFKVTESFFVGVYGQFTKGFAKETGEGAAKTSSSGSTTTVGFTAGYQF